MIRFFLALFLSLMALISSAQSMTNSMIDLSTLPAPEQARIKSMQAKLNLSEQQNELIPSLYVHYQGLIDEQKSIMNTLAEEKTTNEEARLEALNMRSEQIKKIREERDLSVELALTPEQKEIYLTQIKIAKPQVLHFGVHDRMNCPVCVSPTPAP